MNEFVIQLDEEVEGMQATICVLQQQLKEAKQHSDKLALENQKLRTRIEDVLTSRQTNNVSQDSTASDSLEHKRTDIRSPERSNKQERTNHSANRDHVSTSSKRDLISPSTKNRDHLSPSSTREERMDVDKKDSTQKSASQKKIDRKENSENRPSVKTVKVTRQAAETLKSVEPSNNPYVSPPKGVKTFSINHLLSGGNDCIKKDGDSPSKLPVADHRTQENGENGALNGEIDDSVI